MWLAICMMIDDEMYGMMPSANIPKRSSAPPENRLNRPSRLPACWSKKSFSAIRIHAGHRNERADAVYDQRTDQEQDPSLELQPVCSLLSPISAGFCWGFFATFVPG